MLKKCKLTPVQILAIGFASVILIGGILLSLPISSADGTSTPFIDSVFTSTSAVCVTGLVAVDTGTHWSVFGKTIIIMLIQIGGLGFMAFATLFALLVGKKITLKERLIMQESMNYFNLQGLVKLAKYVLIFTFGIEGAGALMLSTVFIPQFGFTKGLAYSLFHAISAFCNAGFDLLGGEYEKFCSLTHYYDNPVVILTIGFLIIIGGLGFAVLTELYNFNYSSRKKVSLHTKVALSMTIGLVLIGSILMFLFEFNNPGTMKNMSFGGKLLSSFFAAVSPRTAGFNSISTSDMTVAGRFLTIFLMFIGGCPGSTAGGVKTTTIGLLLMTAVCVIKGREDTEIFKKKINKELVYRALAIIMSAIALVVTVVMLLSITEAGMEGLTLEALIYEATSAFATVGLTLGITTKLSVIGKVIIAITMYCGRVGPLTLALALAKRKRSNGVKYPEDKILL